MISHFKGRAHLGASAIVLLSSPALSDAGESAADRDDNDTTIVNTTIVVTGTLESREMRTLDTPALGVAIDADHIGAINTINAEDAIRHPHHLQSP